MLNNKYFAPSRARNMLTKVLLSNAGEKTDLQSYEKLKPVPMKLLNSNINVQATTSGASAKMNKTNFNTEPNKQLKSDKVVNISNDPRNTVVQETVIREFPEQRGNTGPLTHLSDISEDDDDSVHDTNYNPSLASSSSDSDQDIPSSIFKLTTIEGTETSNRISVDEETSNRISVDEEMSSTENKDKKPKKRTRNENLWKRNVKKMLHNSGKTYITKSGRILKKKK